MAIVKKNDARAGIAVTGPQARRDQMLLSGYFGEAAAGQAVRELDIEQAHQLKRNKFSLLPSGCDGNGKLQTSVAMGGLVAEQQAGHQHWQELLTMAGLVLDRLEASYVLMKALRSPFALMSDVDLLVPQPLDIATLAGELEAAGFALYRFRLLAHPLKVMAAPMDHVLKGLPSIDFYPDAMWIRKHVLDGPGVITRRRRQGVRGVSIWTPCSEDDLYLVATHAFAHGNFTLAELDHGTRLIRQEAFDWSRVLRSAAAFGCQDGVYAYLRLLVCVSQCIGVESKCPAQVIAELERAPACRAIRQWLDRAEQELTLPVRVPLWLGTVRSAVHHLPAVSRRIRLSELAMDAATHGFNIGIHLLRRGWS